MINRNLKIISALLMISLCSPALAGRPGSNAVDHLDADGDELVSFEEFQPRKDRAGKILEQADLNDDGAITLEEMRTAHAEKYAQRQSEAEARMATRLEKMEQNFLEMDTDDSGSVTPEEFRQHRFNQIDENQDGYISKEEFNQQMQKMRDRHSGRRS